MFITKKSKCLRKLAPSYKNLEKVVEPVVNEVIVEEQVEEEKKKKPARGKKETHAEEPVVSENNEIENE